MDRLGGLLGNSVLLIDLVRMPSDDPVHQIERFWEGWCRRSLYLELPLDSVMRTWNALDGGVSNTALSVSRHEQEMSRRKGRQPNLRSAFSLGRGGPRAMLGNHADSGILRINNLSVFSTNLRFDSRRLRQHFGLLPQSVYPFMAFGCLKLLQR